MASRDFKADSLTKDRLWNWGDHMAKQPTPCACISRLGVLDRFVDDFKSSRWREAIPNQFRVIRVDALWTTTFDAISFDEFPVFRAVYCHRFSFAIVTKSMGESSFAETVGACKCLHRRTGLARLVDSSVTSDACKLPMSE